MNQLIDNDLHYLKEITRSIKDYPKPGIIFRDVTTIFKDPRGMSIALEAMLSFIKDEKHELLEYDKIVGIEARGFVLAGGMAGRAGGGVVLARKPGKLPFKSQRMEYQLEYGTDALELHVDAIRPGDKVVIVDDLLATGGTAEAACKLVEMQHGKIIKVIFLVELPALRGRERLAQYNVESAITFEGD